MGAGPGGVGGSRGDQEDQDGQLPNPELQSRQSAGGEPRNPGPRIPARQCELSLIISPIKIFWQVSSCSHLRQCEFSLLISPIKMCWHIMSSCSHLRRRRGREQLYYILVPHTYTYTFLKIIYLRTSISSFHPNIVKQKLQTFESIKNKHH